MKESKHGKLGRAIISDKNIPENRSLENEYLTNEELERMQESKGKMRKSDGPEKDEPYDLANELSKEEFKNEVPPTECEDPE